MGITAAREAWGEKFDSVRRWLTYIASEKTGSESTKDLYLLALERWCTFISKTPDEIIADRDSDLQKTEFAQKHRHEDLLRQAFNDMEAKGYARASCGAFFAAIRSFYKANYCPFEAKRPTVWTTRLFKVPNQKELELIWKQADPRMKLWILFQKDSGISCGDLIDLTLDTQSTAYGSIRDQLKSGQVPIHANIMRSKVEAVGHYDTYFGEEAFNFLQEAQPKDRLFDISLRYVKDLLPKAAKKAGIKGPPVTTHCLRKYFNTYAKIGIRNYGATELLVEYWMGHSIGRVKGAYLAPPVEEQAKLYLTAYPMLRCLG